MLPYRYTVGNAVQLAPRTPIRQIIWRGRQQVQLLTGKWHEVAVYRIDDGHWDCYYESELHSALRWGDDDYRSSFSANPYS